MKESILSNEILEEFFIEADELIVEAEESLLAIDKDDNNFSDAYNSVFRCLHTLKGAAGMFELLDLQAFVHQVEDKFTEYKDKDSIPSAEVDLFLSWIDLVKAYLAKQPVNFPDLASTGSQKNEEESEKPDLKLVEDNNCLGIVAIVDDEEAVLETLMMIVEDLGYHVLSYKCPEHLIKDFNQNKEKFEMVLSDYNMPEMNGVELTKRLKVVCPETPVVLISGYLTEEVIKDAVSVGVYDFVDKPFVEGRVGALVKNAVERRRSLRLVNESIGYILQQFSELDEYLEKQGRNQVRNSLQRGIRRIMKQQDKLKKVS